MTIILISTFAAIGILYASWLLEDVRDRNSFRGVRRFGQNLRMAP